MESIFFRRLEPRRSTQSIFPVNALGLEEGLFEINPSLGVMPLDMMTTSRYSVYTAGPTYHPEKFVLGSCPWIDSPGLQSVVGTMGDMFGGSGYQFGQYGGLGTANWGGYNPGVGGLGAGIAGVGKVLGSCPWIDSPGLQSVVGTLGDIYSTPYKLSTYNNTYSVSNFSNAFNAYGVAGCGYISGVCPYIGGGGCTFFGGCMVIDPAPFTSIIGTLDSFRQY